MGILAGANHPNMKGRLLHMVAAWLTACGHSNHIVGLRRSVAGLLRVLGRGSLLLVLGA